VLIGLDWPGDGVVAIREVDVVVGRETEDVASRGSASTMLLVIVMLLSDPIVKGPSTVPGRTHWPRVESVADSLAKPHPTVTWASSTGETALAVLHSEVSAPRLTHSVFWVRV
jgi:hypothetical protein